MFQTIWDAISSPFRIGKLWKTSKPRAVGAGVLVVAKTAGAIILWYNPWILLNAGLPIIGVIGPTMTRVVVSGIKFLFI